MPDDVLLVICAAMNEIPRQTVFQDGQAVNVMSPL
jgi:hypothetical protein